MSSTLKCLFLFVSLVGTLDAQPAVAQGNPIQFMPPITVPAACIPERNQIMTNIIVERNFFESTINTRNHVLVGATDVAVRNNISNMALGSVQNAVTIERCGSDPAPKNVAVANNTFYSDSTGFNAIKLAELDSSISATNNLGYAPNSNSPAISAVGLATQANLVLANNDFINAVLTEPEDYELQPSSPAVNAGVVSPSVIDTFDVSVRRDIGTQRDVGVYEQ